MNARILTAVSLTALLAACSTTSSAPASWGYEGETGPSHWGDLDPAYAMAKEGRRQSPIDIRPGAAVAGPADALTVDYHATTIDILNNGHTIEDDYHGGGRILLGGHEYSLAQFHFHSPSEHTVDGAHFPLEMHLVHKDADGNLAVIGVLIAEGDEHAVLARLGPHVPTEPGRSGPVEGVTVDASDLLPSSLASYRYSGSLTTPPCSEDVAWIVLQQPIEVSKRQIENFRGVIFGNNRPTQPLNGRTVTRAE